ncbi:MAG: FGGY family carbohydrate kinase [Planctomycetaceae bacterium]
MLANLLKPAIWRSIDSWLVWKLTGGTVHVTDVTNASRTMICDIHRAEWDDDLLKALKIPRSVLQTICSSSEVYGETTSSISVHRFLLLESRVISRPHCFGPDVYETRDGQEYLWNRLFHADEYRDKAASFKE